LYLLPETPDPDYVFFDTQRFKWPMSDEEYNIILQSFLNNANYILLSDKEGFYLFKKKTGYETVK
jgi:outer membrane biogenesis lipoprotein LolB